MRDIKYHFIRFSLSSDIFLFSAKVFPGNLQVKKPFKDEMTDTTSKEFIETANEIIAEVSN